MQSGARLLSGTIRRQAGQSFSREESMPPGITTATEAFEAVLEAGAGDVAPVLDESNSGFLENGRIPSYRLQVFKEKPERHGGAP